MNLIEGYRNHMMSVGRIHDRMTRAEFWPYFIFNIFLMFLFEKFIRPYAFELTGFIRTALIFAVLIFYFGPVIQRVNDANLRKRFLLVLIVPYVGVAIVTLMLLQKSYPATTQYGPCRA